MAVVISLRSPPHSESELGKTIGYGGDVKMNFEIYLVKSDVVVICKIVTFAAAELMKKSRGSFWR
jgi:hypothetical protein